MYVIMLLLSYNICTNTDIYQKLINILFLLFRIGSTSTDVRQVPVPARPYLNICTRKMCIGGMLELRKGEKANLMQTHPGVHQTKLSSIILG
jgi:hypothetical protein